MVEIALQKESEHDFEKVRGVLWIGGCDVIKEVERVCLGNKSKRVQREGNQGYYGGTSNRRVDGKVRYNDAERLRGKNERLLPGVRELLRENSQQIRMPL